MADYTLNLDFSSDSLKLIDASKQNLVVIKPVTGNQSGNPVWVNIDPFQQNKVDWSEDYSIYTSASGPDQAATTVDTNAEPGIDLTPESDLFIA